MVLAEETGVSGESMSGKGGFYDGWAGVKQLLQGDPALVRKEKGHRYSLTTQVCLYLFFSCIYHTSAKTISRTLSPFEHSSHQRRVVEQLHTLYIF